MIYFILHIILSSFLFSGLENTAIDNKHEGAIAVIIHESVDTRDINEDILLDIYTLSKQRWDYNTRIRVADYKGTPDIRDAFYDALNTTPNNMKKIWLRAQFTGRTTPPIVVNSVDEMIETVVDNPGTIGYVPVDEVPANVKIILELYD